MFVAKEIVKRSSWTHLLDIGMYPDGITHSECDKRPVELIQWVK